MMHFLKVIYESLLYLIFAHMPQETTDHNLATFSLINLNYLTHALPWIDFFFNKKKLKIKCKLKSLYMYLIK